MSLDVGHTARPLLFSAFVIIPGNHCQDSQTSSTKNSSESRILAFGPLRQLRILHLYLSSGKWRDLSLLLTLLVSESDSQHHACLWGCQQLLYSTEGIAVRKRSQTRTIVKKEASPTSTTDMTVLRHSPPQPLQF